MPRLCFLAVLVTISGLALPPCGTAAADEATLAALARSALETHESVARAESQVRRAQADVGLARSVLLPRLDINGAHVWYQEAQVLELAPGESFVLRPDKDWSWSADLRQTLFYGLRDWRARDVALLQRDIARLERRTASADLVLEVAAAFFQAVTAGQRLDVARTVLEQLEAQLKVASRRYEVGEAARADVLRWEAQVAAQRQQVVINEGERELALRRLARKVGRQRLGDLQPPGPIPVPQSPEEQLVSQALEQRLEMITLRHQLEAVGLYVKIEKGAWLPELEASAQYFQQKAQFPSEDWISATLSLKIPIYDGGLTSARVAQAREDLFEVELLERELRKAITDQVESAAIQLRSAIAGLEAARQSREAAAEAHRQLEHAYRVGEATATDLLSATASLTDAENSLIIARAQRQLASIGLRHAVGESPLPDLDLAPDATATAPAELSDEDRGE